MFKILKKDEKDHFLGKNAILSLNLILEKTYL